MMNDLTRREAMTSLAAAAAGLAAVPALAGAGRSGQPPTVAPAKPVKPEQPATPAPLAPTGPLVLPALPYDKAALEPSIDGETMEIHHDRHHKAYVDNGNKALAGTKWATMTAEVIVAQLSEIPDDKRSAIRNNVGGHLNHSWFWKWMAPASKGGGGEPTGALADAIKSTFGSFGGDGGFKEKFAAAGAGRFGSGWAWLCVTPDKKLAICSTANQDNPLMGEKIAGAGCVGTPILGLDVWEHAYYLKYRNARPGYIKAWWDVVNWGEVSTMYAAQVKAGK